MSSAVLKWGAGVAGMLAAGSVVAMLTMWADVRQMKSDAVQLRETLASGVKAERIATLEAQVVALEKTDLKHEASISALWRVRGGRSESP